MRPGVAPSIEEPKVRAVGLLAASVGLLAASVGLLAVDAKRAHPSVATAQQCLLNLSPLSRRLLRVPSTEDEITTEAAF
jgi:hypothetical protein